MRIPSARVIGPNIFVSGVFGLVIFGIFFICFLLLFIGNKHGFFVDTDASSYVGLVGLGEKFDGASVAEVSASHGRRNLHVLIKFDEESNLEMHLKEKFCIQGDYCWKPMRDWPGQYEIRVDGVLKPDGSGWDLWSGELTEEQPFPSYSHFILNTNTNQLHIIVNTGSVPDQFVIN